MEPSTLEVMNDELIEAAEPDIVIDKKDKEIKKNSKRDIINRIFEITEKFNLEISETQAQLLRKTRKELLAILANYIEKSMDAKAKEGQNGIPADSQNSSYVTQLPMLKLMHGFLCSCVEKGVNYSMTLMDWNYELRNYASTCGSSHLMDDVLVEIANDIGPDLMEYLSSPYYKLVFIHATSIMSCIRKVDKQQMESPRFNIDQINLAA
jgi:hypothetical protein